ncbi:MAG: hypothetical protein IJU41_05270, partial [Clostridia bacterium]|nr:hypothetical protein [Clostridia bacterium]
MKKRILFAFLFSVLLVAFSLLAHATDIGSANDLLTLMNTSSMWSGSYTLTADIDLSTATNGLPQAPIGNATTAFTGSFDGDGHTVSGINITAATTYTGLFGKAAGAVIRNLTVAGTVSSTANYTGGLLGGVDGASVTLQNCVNRCTVSGAASTGGIIGRVDAGTGTATISGCKNEGTITGSGSYAGGIIGTSSQSGAYITTENCLNTGAIRGNKYVGGIVGYWRAYSASANKCILRDCLNTGTVYATTTVAGGIMGTGNGANYAYTLTRVFNSGSVTIGGSAYLRPIAGATSKATSTAGQMTYCYYSSTGSYTNDSTGYSAANETYVADATVAANMPGLATDAWILVDGHTPELSVFHTHDHSGAYVSVGAMHQKTCWCGAVVDSAAHTFEGGVCTACGAEDIPCAHENKYEIIETPATCTATGIKYEFCPDCNTQVSENIVIPVDPANHGANALTMAYANGAITYTCVCGATVYTDSTLSNAVYVSENGLDLVGNLSGVGTMAKPFKNFTDAVQYAAYCGKDVTITILDTASTPASYATPAFDDTITVTGGTLVTDNRFLMNGKFVFEHMTISPSVTLVMAAKEHKLVMGEGLTMSGSSIYLVGGYEHVLCANADIPATGYSTDVTLRSGSYGAVGGGNRYLSGAYAGTINLTIGKTNPADTLQITSTLTLASMNAEGGDGVYATLLIDGPVDNINSFCPVTHATTADGRFDVDIVVQGAATTAAEKLYYRGSNYTVTVYADDRVEGAEEFAQIVAGEGNVQPYKRYCVKINGGTHPDANGDELCDNCGASTVCTHEYGEWRLTAAANCASPAIYTWYCDDCRELIGGMTKNGDALDGSNHISENFVWQGTSGNYYFTCTACGAHVAQGDPVLYVSQSGNNALDGTTAERAVATLAEAVSRLANVGGRVVIVGAYNLTGNLTLPAYQKEITICGADNAGEYDGFVISKNVVITLGGKTKFDKISFGGSAVYTFECLWNDTVFGTVQPYATATANVILGRCGITANDTAVSSATLTITEGTSQRIVPSGRYVSRFYAYIYLGDTFGADGVSVSNKIATLNATDADIGILYTMSTSGKYKNDPVT